MSPSPSPLKREKKVYVCVEEYPVHEKSGTIVWYAIDNNNSEDEEEGKIESLSHVFEQASDSPSDPKFVAWKSYIFSIGGSVLIKGSISLFNPSSDVLYIDTRHPQQGWKRGPRLKQARWNPHCLVYDGKICVLGGCQMLPIYPESLLPFSESRWSRMDMGPSKEVPINTIGYAVYEDKLFVHGSSSAALHSYDFRTDIWKEIEGDFFWEFPCASSVDDEIIYLVEGGKFMGFDLIKHQWYKGVGLQQNKMLPPYIHKGNSIGVPSSLVHLGNGTLCLLWIGSVLAGFRAIHCTKFNVRKEYDDTEGCFIIKANVKSFKVYEIPRGYLVGSLAVDPGEESDHGKEENEDEKSARDLGKSATITTKEKEWKLPRRKKNNNRKKVNKRLGTEKAYPA